MATNEKLIATTSVVRFVRYALIRSMPSIMPKPRNSILPIVMSLCAAKPTHASTAISDATVTDAKLGVGSGNSDECGSR